MKDHRSNRIIWTILQGWKASLMRIAVLRTVYRGFCRTATLHFVGFCRWRKDGVEWIKKKKQQSRICYVNGCWGWDSMDSQALLSRSPAEVKIFKLLPGCLSLFKYGCEDTLKLGQVLLRPTVIIPRIPASLV